MDQNINKTILDNGTRILSKKIPHVHSVSMGVWVNVGARDESLQENGLSHFIEHMIFKGTKKRSALQIAKEFDAIGGHTNAFTSMELTCYHAKVMDTHLETMTSILSDIFLNSEFDEREVQKERPVIFQEIAMVEDSPEEYVHTLLGNDFWGDHSLGRSILGTRENIASFNSETIKEFVQRFYQPNQIVISLAGNVDHDHVVSLLRPFFETIKQSSRLPERKKPTPCSKVTLVHRDLEQIHICMGTEGLCVTDPKRYAFSLLNTIVGGNMSSRLFQKIRERRGLAYSVYSFISSHRDSGMFGAYLGVATQNELEAAKLVFDEIKKIREVRVDPSELQEAKEYTKGNIMLSSESTDNQMVRIAQNEIHFNRYIPIQEVMDLIDGVTEDEIYELAGNLFKGNKFSVTMLGPASGKETIEKIINDF